MRKILKNLFLLIVITMLLIVFFQTYSSASSFSNKMGDELNHFENTNYTTSATTNITNITGTIITVARIIGVAVAIVMLLVISMKYMTAAPGDKADIKKSAVAYVVGAVVLFGAVGILGIINKFSSVIK